MFRIHDDRLGEPVALLDGAPHGAEVGERLGSACGLRDDHHLAAADQTVRPGIIVVEDVRVQRRGRSVEQAQGLLLHLVLDAAAAEGPDLPAGGIDDHDRPGLLRRRAPRLHDLAEDHRPVLLQGLDQLPDEFAHALSHPEAGSVIPATS